MGTICAAHHLEDRRASPQAGSRMLGTGGFYMHRWLLGMSLVAAISVGALCEAARIEMTYPVCEVLDVGRFSSCSAYA